MLRLGIYFRDALTDYLLTACGLPRRRPNSDSRLSRMLAGGLAALSFGALSTVVQGDRAAGAIAMMFAARAIVGLVQCTPFPQMYH